MHTVALIIFILAVTAWLKFEMKMPKDMLRTYWKWVVAAIILQLAAIVLAAAIDGKVGNFLQHTIGGGMVSTVLFFYLKHMFHFHTNWRTELVLLFMFVSTLGVLNELAEYAIEFIGLEVFSYDTHDTWRDITANSLGALLAWLVIKPHTKREKT